MNPYNVLGVAPGAERDEVRRAWRLRAFETHPDHGGDGASFDLVQQAFVRLSSSPAGSARAPVVVRRMDPGALALRWYRRRRDRLVRPRVV